MRIHLCAPCHFGLERTLKFEISKIGGENIRAQDGRVLFDGDELVLAKANLCLSAAERVLICLGEAKVYTFEELYQAVKALPLADWIGREDAFPVKGHCLDSKLHSVPDCQSIIKKAAVDRLGQRYGVRFFEESGAVHPIQFSLRKNYCTFYLDTSGVGLYKRGYRRNAVAAPIKETLAAGIIDAAHVRSDTVLCDPFCGSGTFLIEAAYKALHIAPGLRRRFLAESWSQIPQTVWRSARQEAMGRIQRDTGFFACGYDIDPAAVALAQENCERAGVAAYVQVEQRDIADFVPVEGITVCNPPYGERLLDIEQAQAIYRTMGQVFPANQAHPCHIITPDADFELYFGRPADKRRKLYNGMIQCQLMSYFK